MEKPLKISKFKGLKNTLPAQEFGIEFLQEALNVDIDDNMFLRRRPGTNKVVTADVFSLWSNGTICLYRTGATLKRMLSDYTSTTLRSGLTTDKIPMAYLSLNNLVYYSEILGIIHTTYASIDSY
jgi:hypothetical protein